MRTDAEILTRVEAVESLDFFGTQAGDLLEVLPFDAVKPFLKDDATEADWKPLPRDQRSVKARIHEYMEFAWGKANGCRGLSAARSLDHMSAWLWLLGYDEAANTITDYDRYGKPQLRAICEHFGWDWTVWDNGEWVNSEDGPDLGVPETVAPLPVTEAVA